MSTEVKNEGAAGAAAGAEAGAPAQGGEDIKNLKAEFSRKQGNIEQQMTNLQKTQADLLSQLQRMGQAFSPAAASTTKVETKLSDLMYSDPEAYATEVESRATRKAQEMLQNERAAVSKQQQVIETLVKDFPELRDGENELTVKAVEIFNSMPEEDRKSPVAYRAAVKEAALELGVKPKSKRSADESESFSLGNSRSTQQASKGERKMDSRTKTFAELMGVDEAKVKARMNGRKSFTAWE